LIEPVLAGRDQFNKSQTPFDFNFANCMSPTCMTTIPASPTTPEIMPTCDVYNCDKAVGWANATAKQASAGLTKLTTLSIALGVNARTIEWLKKPARTRAYGRASGEIIAAPEMDALFGTLDPGDNYFLSLNQAAGVPYSGANSWASPGVGLLHATDFVNHLRKNVATFITVTKFDRVVYTPDIPYAFGFYQGTEPTFASLIAAIRYSQSDVVVPGIPRPGFMGVDYAQPVESRSVVMPFRYNSGHSVTMRAPAELLADVTKWYQFTPH
jgi:hypothetical protein